MFRNKKREDRKELISDIEILIDGDLDGLYYRHPQLKDDVYMKDLERRIKDLMELVREA